jgi:hypothetical protein
MLLGELQCWSWAARGCVRRSLFVRLSYAFKASSKMIWKLEDEADEAEAG